MGHRVWILLAMTHLTLDFSACSPLSQSMGIRLMTKAVPHPRPTWQPLWDTTNKLHWRTMSPLVRRLFNPAVQDSGVGIGPKVKGLKHLKLMRNDQAACKDCRLKHSEMETEDPQVVISEAPAASFSGRRGGTFRLLRRTRRQLKWDSYDKAQEGRTTTVAGFIDWGPTGTDNIDDDNKPELNMTLSTRVPTTTVATTTSTTARVFQRTFTVVTTPEPRRLSTTKATVNEGTVKPPKPYVETSGEISTRQSMMVNEQCGLTSFSVEAHWSLKKIEWFQILVRCWGKSGKYQQKQSIIECFIWCIFASDFFTETTVTCDQ